MFQNRFGEPESQQLFSLNSFSSFTRPPENELNELKEVNSFNSITREGGAVEEAQGQAQQSHAPPSPSLVKSADLTGSAC